VNIIVAREDNKDSQAVKELVEAYQTDATVRAADAIYHGDAVKGW